MWQHCLDKEGALHEQPDSWRTGGFNNNLSKQSYQIRNRGKFPLIVPLQVNANSTNRKLTFCSVSTEPYEDVRQPCHSTKRLIPIVTKIGKTCIKCVSPPARWNKMTLKLSTYGGKRLTLLFLLTSYIATSSCFSHTSYCNITRSLILVQRSSCLGWAIAWGKTGLSCIFATQQKMNRAMLKLLKLPC